MIARGSRSLSFVGVLIALVAIAVLASLTSSAGAVSTSLVINEVDYDQPSTDTAEFLELKNSAPPRSISTRTRSSSSMGQAAVQPSIRRSTSRT